MRKLIVMLSVLLLVLSLNAAALAQDGMTLTVMRFFGDCVDQFGDVTDLSGVTSECGIITTLTNIWNAENPDVQVETIVADWPGTTQLNASIAAGTPPDIAVLHGRRIPIYASRGALTTLTDVMEAVGIDASDFTEGAADYGLYQGEFYGIPFDLAATIWHINVDLWAEAGLVDDMGAPMLPTSPEEFISAAEQIHAATGKPIAEMAGQAGTVRSLTAYIYQKGGALADDAGNPTIDTPEALEALNFILDLQELGVVSRPYNEINGAIAVENFANGESAGMIDGTWRINGFDPSDRRGRGGAEELLRSRFPAALRAFRHLRRLAQLAGPAGAKC